MTYINLFFLSNICFYKLFLFFNVCNNKKT
nr:MAG TPA: hypothetical protein [Caudoviricetes sp.]DAT56644.1 MAG TPA: hypothetical protein [Caudoviricetes sp.]